MAKSGVHFIYFSIITKRCKGPEQYSKNEKYIEKQVFIKQLHFTGIISGKKLIVDI